MLKNFFKEKKCVIGLIMLLGLIIVAVFCDKIAPYSLEEGIPAEHLMSPSNSHIFGQDEYGRDVFSRIIYGTPLALKTVFLGALIELTIGVVLGLISGYCGKIVDSVITFVGDVIWSLPGIVIAMTIVMLLGRDLDNVIFALALAGWPRYQRMVRSKTYMLKNQPFVETGRSFGENPIAILFLYILPSVLPSVLVMASISMPGFITSSATLSFLGMGAQPPSPDWGLAIGRSASVIFRAPWLVIFPCLALIYTIITFSLLGEGVRNLIDPNMKN